MTIYNISKGFWNVDGEIYPANTFTGKQAASVHDVDVEGYSEAELRAADYLRIRYDVEWCARWSMPGYLDCGEWHTGETERDALQQLLDMDGGEDDEWEQQAQARIKALTEQDWRIVNKIRDADWKTFHGRLCDAIEYARQLCTTDATRYCVWDGAEKIAEVRFHGAYWIAEARRSESWRD